MSLVCGERTRPQGYPYPSANKAGACLVSHEYLPSGAEHCHVLPFNPMSGRFHPLFLARDYDKCVVAKGKCRLDDPPKKYKPLFTVVDFSSIGFRTMFDSWIVHRIVHPVSALEYHGLLMFHAPDSGVVNISEQVALEPSITQEIARALGLKHPAHRGEDVIMSSDFVVTFERAGGRLERQAFSLKREQDITPRVLEKFAIEFAYWRSRKIILSFILDTKLPRQLIDNVELIMEFYDPDRLPCDRRVIDLVGKWIISHLVTKDALRNVCSQCDRTLGLARGTALAVTYHLTATRVIPLNLRTAFLPNAAPSLVVS